MAKRLHIVAYDVANPARLRRMHRLLKARGAWHQLSVFLLRLGAGEKRALVEELRKIMDMQEDRVLIAPLSGEDAGEILCLGLAEPFPGPRIVIV